MKALLYFLYLHLISCKIEPYPHKRTLRKAGSSNNSLNVPETGSSFKNRRRISTSIISGNGPCVVPRTVQDASARWSGPEHAQPHACDTRARAKRAHPMGRWASNSCARQANMNTSSLFTLLLHVYCSYDRRHVLRVPLPTPCCQHERTHGRHHSKQPRPRKNCRPNKA